MSRSTGRPSAEEIVAALNRAGSVKDAARELGCVRPTLHDWMRELGIRRGDWRLVEEPEGAASAR